MDPFFHLTKSMRTAKREGSLVDIAFDSMTSPEKVAPSGITTLFTRVAKVSFASTFFPTGVLPAIMLSRIVTGNSWAKAGFGREETGADELDCASKNTGPGNAAPNTSTTEANVHEIGTVSFLAGTLRSP